MMIRAGSLTERISLLRYTETDDGYNTVRDFISVGSYPASVEPLSDGEVWRAGAAQTKVSHRVTMRLTPSLTIKTTDQIEYRGENYEVKTVREFPRQGYAEITIARGG